MTDLLHVARKLARTSHLTRDASAVQERLLSHEGQRETQAAVEGMVRTQSFWIPTVSTGIFRSITCKFSFGFTHRPHFTYAYVLAPRQPITDRYPSSMDATVIDWMITNGDDPDIPNDPGVQWTMHYGCKVNAVVAGPPTPVDDGCKEPTFQRGMIQLNFTGQSITYPVADVNLAALFTSAR